MPPDPARRDGPGGAQIVVQLDRQSADERLRRALDLQSWLVVSGVIRPVQLDANIEIWTPGTLWRSAVDVSAAYPFEVEVRDNTVEVSAEIEVYSSLGIAEDAACPRCETALAVGGRLGDLLDEWISVGEPVVACAHCGWAALLGDWPTDRPRAVAGAPAVTFTNWPPLRASFVAAVVGRFGGGRCRYVRQYL